MGGTLTMDGMKMRSPKRKKNLIFLLGLIVVFCAGIATSTSAQEIKKGWQKPEHYPERFTDQGWIQEIRYSEIIMDDRLLVISPLAKFYTPQWSDVPLSKFNVGDYVGVNYDFEGRVIGIWLIK
jgi:hypothetical protein